MVRDSLPPKDASAYQIWNSYFKEYRRFLPDTKRDGRNDAPTVGYLLGTYSVRKCRQERVSTQQILDNFNVINLILSKLAHFRKFKVPNKGPFVRTDGQCD